MSSHPPANPDNYPHTLKLEDGHVFLVTSSSALGDTVAHRDLGNSPTVRSGYSRWKHLLDDHDRNHANIFLWGFMTGMSANLVTEMDDMIRSIRGDRL